LLRGIRHDSGVSRDARSQDDDPSSVGIRAKQIKIVAHKPDSRNFMTSFIMLIIIVYISYLTIRAVLESAPI
jgi:hypothetical protein